jgi:hypothetical protein
MLKILGVTYILIIVGLFLEAYLCAEIDPETKKYLDNREKNQKK